MAARSSFAHAGWMPRKPRFHVPGSMHHVTAHGIESSPLYRDDHDRWRFIGILDAVTRETQWRLLGFCLMDTHYHLLVEERETPLSRSMRLVNGRYATAFNDRHERTGHLFNGRYRDTAIESDSHLLSAVRYVALNPVAVYECTRPQDWPWGTYGQLIGAATGWSFVSAAWTLSLFSPHRDRAIQRVREFVESVPGT
jgi:REP element-mobilizing transposase RayT